MSRIAKTPITVPAGVEVNIAAADGAVSVRAKGKLGERSIALLPGIQVAQADGVLQIAVGDDDAGDQKLVAMSGTARAMIHNLIHGVSEGFERRLSIVGVGYRANAQGKKLNLSLGFSHPVVYQLPDGVTAETPTNTEIVSARRRQTTGRSSRRRNPRAPSAGAV